MLTYTQERLLTQQAVIQRDFSEPDAHGADEAPDWRDHLTVPCLHSWARSEGSRTTEREYATPQRVVPISEGGVIVALGTDVTEDDQIRTILDRAGNTLIDGILEIVSVLTEQTHIELGVVRAHLGG